MPPAAISCHALRKVYRSGFFRRPFVGLHGLDLEVQPGEIFGFIGPNGAGKTTTIKILMGLQAATGGTAHLLGIDHRDPESKRRVGFLPERPYFYEYLTAREFLRFYGQLFDLHGAPLEKRIDELLERLLLARFRDVPLREYSKGMLQRAGVAQALVNDPDLVVLDEPMSGLDPMGRKLIRDLILEERRRGRTVFFSSHILADVEMICDRVGMIVYGKLRGAGAVSELVGQRVEHVDCTFRLPRELALPGERLRTEGEVVMYRMSPEDVDRAVEQVVQIKGSVLELHPHRETLENLLADEVERNRSVDPSRMGVLN